ncbi:hypothetical protein M8C21_018208 [Ambrosia artemisiifolia]|uniref:Uncharacterized protein n=1 Tax=Ambrosia artemisiifolia TaxID=4212 RepID=A0AAD5CEP6_AMBAR|nr:hypothetical protein M8C21_018208 [Ambrosia artemisiifolia]
MHDIIERFKRRVKNPRHMGIRVRPITKNRLNPDIPILEAETRDHQEESLVSEVVDKKNAPSYKRSLSGGLRSPKSDVPKKAILERIHSKKMARSYQLGHQLSLKWSTGAGP